MCCRSHALVLTRRRTRLQEKDILIFRFDSSLHFANRLFFENKLTEQFRRRARCLALPKRPNPASPPSFYILDPNFYPYRAYALCEYKAATVSTRCLEASAVCRPSRLSLCSASQLA